ncbi:F0F1 ATP synthase subunit gamma [Pseudogemmobacter sp. W21_MBD1_M6]|uniref:F0F1 ATP synthase subunit gamma n=1 Tax=Pseudogemmobacter sp. W21_MBD1_M6 TaxID=3240271 RepID=UPI003F9D6771
MTVRLADISARLDGLRQLGSVVGAMTGIAAARARVARDHIAAVDSYAAAIAAAMGQVTDPDTLTPPPASGTDRLALLVFCAEQGFAGAFSERIIASLPDDKDRTAIFLVGTRGIAIAKSGGMKPYWTGAMPSHSPGIPRFADQLVQAIYALIGSGRIDRLETVHSEWSAGTADIRRSQIFPIDLSTLPARTGPAPLKTLPDADLLAALGADYFHALVCNTALHAFTAENEARMAATTSASSQIARETAKLEAVQRRVRQEAITAEIIELATGEQASKKSRSRR